MLNAETMDAAMAVPAGDGSVSRTIIDGAVVIYDLDDVPRWLRPILLARDENGSVADATCERAWDADGVPIIVEYSVGTAITGVVV